MNTELIAELRRAAWAGPVPCPVCDRAADALEAAQAEIVRLKSDVERLNHKDKLITQYTEDGTLIDRLYAAGLQQETELCNVTRQRDTALAEVARLTASYTVELNKVSQRNYELRKENDAALAEVAAWRKNGAGQYQCADCKSRLMPGYDCGACGSFAAEEAAGASPVQPAACSSNSPEIDTQPGLPVTNEHQAASHGQTAYKMAKALADHLAVTPVVQPTHAQPFVMGGPQARERMLNAQLREYGGKPLNGSQPSQDADPNAPWLSDAHMLCADQGIPPGHITDRIRALRDKLEQPAQMPAGYVLVPVEPTEAMCRAAIYNTDGDSEGDWEATINNYRLMLAAAPDTSQKEES